MRMSGWPVKLSSSVPALRFSASFLPMRRKRQRGIRWGGQFAACQLPRRSVPHERAPKRCRAACGRVMRLGWPSSWIILLGLALGAILPAAGAQSGAAPPSTVDAKVQSSLHLRVISALNVVHDAVDRTLTTVATAPAEAQRLQSEATQRWRSGDILRAAIYCLVLLMIGADAEWLYWCYAGKGWRAIAEAAVGRETLPPARAATLGLRRAALSAVGATIFICGVLVPLSLFSWPTEVQASVVGVILAITLALASHALLRYSSCPRTLLGYVSSPNRIGGARRLTFALVALSAILAGALSAQSLLQGVFDAPGLTNIVSAASGTVVAGLSLFVLHLWRSAPAPGTKRSSGTVIYPIALTTRWSCCAWLCIFWAPASSYRPLCSGRRHTSSARSCGPSSRPIPARQSHSAQANIDLF